MASFQSSLSTVDEYAYGNLIQLNLHSHINMGSLPKSCRQSWHTSVRSHTSFSLAGDPALKCGLAKFTDAGRVLGPLFCGLKPSLVSIASCAVLISDFDKSSEEDPDSLPNRSQTPLVGDRESSDPFEGINS
jgi:hypothetical protein